MDWRLRYEASERASAGEAEFAETAGVVVSDTKPLSGHKRDINAPETGARGGSQIRSL